MRLEWRERRPEDLRRWLAGLAAVLLIGAVLAALHLAGVRVCLFRRLTGLPCLTCGSSRAAAALLAGDWREALSLQPLAVTGGFVAGLASAAYSVSLLGLHRAARLRATNWEWCALLCALACLAALNWAYLLGRGI